MQPATRPLFEFRAVVLVSACLGFTVGVYWTATWQVGVEHAQVIAGLIEYPADNSFYYYHLKLWSLLHQLLAVPLLAGVNEQALSVFVSGLLSSVSFLMLSVCTYSICQNASVAAISPILFFGLFLGFGPDTPAYPIYLAMTHHTDGVAGLGIGLTALSLLASSRTRSGLFLLGLSPAVHVPWGAWCILVGSLSVVTSRAAITCLLPHVKWFAMGVSVTVVSFLVQVYLARDLPEVSAAESAPFVQAMIGTVDIHRVAVPLREPAIYLVVLSIVICSCASFGFREDFDESAQLMLRILAISGALSLLCVFLTWIPDRLPEIVTRAMPGRFINLSVILFPALVLGLLGKYRDSRFVLMLTACHILYLPWNWIVVPHLTGRRTGWATEHWREWAIVGASIVAWRFWARLRSGDYFAERPRLEGPYTMIVGLSAAVLIAGTGWAPEFSKSSSYPPFRGERNTTIVEASRRGGVLITSPGMQLIQLRTRRPILVNIAAMDQVSYFPASGALANRALKRVYGSDLLGGGINPNPDWENRTLAEWQSIRDDFGATDVLAMAPFPKLALPIVASNHPYVLYHIPESIPLNPSIEQLD